MKIAFVIERMDTSRGGRETSTAQVAAALAARDHDITLLCQSGSWRDDAVEIVQLGPRGRTRLARLRNFVADVQIEIGRRDFDIVHATLPIPGANVYQPRGGTVPAQKAASLRRRSALARLMCAATWPLNSVRREMARLERQVMADNSVMCLAVSRMVADEFARHYGRRDRAVVVYNAVDAPGADSGRRAEWRRQQRAVLNLSDDGVVFLTVAKNFELKGVRETISAFARWRHSTQGAGEAGARLVLVGRDDIEDYRRLASRLDVSDKVYFAGSADEAEMSRWYAAADACVLLSWYDPCSRVVLEAARWGLPAVTTAFNGASEAIAGGGGIVVSSPHDIPAVAAAMAQLAEGQTRQRCSEICRQLSDSLSMERHVNELVEAYGAAAKLK